MGNLLKKSLLVLTVIFLISIIPVFSEEESILNTPSSIQSAESAKAIDIIVFYGEGCPHCAELEEFLNGIKDKYVLNIISYEVYFNETNRQLAAEMAEQYGDSFRGVPMTFISDKVIMGFSDSISAEIESLIIKCAEECCDSPLDKVKYCQQQQNQQQSQKDKLTIASVIALGFADSVNPCELAILAMALVALLIRDPTKRKNVLLGGLAFTLAVFITYIFYGLIIIQLIKSITVYFQAAQFYARIIFAVLAIFLGIMNFKDYFSYKPGTFATEMPLSFRPIVKNMIKNITRPRGAFIIGVFVTLFLMPCTIGPYLIVGNLLSGFSILQILPWLLLYNLIFVLPMIAITLIVYFGYSTVDKVVGWKDEHIRYLHLAAGIVLAILGILMLIGWV